MKRSAEIPVDPRWARTILRRGEEGESIHLALAVVAPRDSEMVIYGKRDTGAFLRSLAKPFQTLALMRAGIDQEFDLSDLELAVISASHAGEPVHRQVVDGLLEKGGLDLSDLKCGTDPPLSREEQHRMLRAGETADARCKNCSGKHAGMLLHNLSIAGDPGSYLDPSHPVQQRVREILELFTGVDLDQRDAVVDGCGAPTWRLSLAEMARGFSRLHDTDFVSAAGLETAAARLNRAFRRHPREFSGAGRTPFLWSSHLAPDFLSKEGAEGSVAVWGEKGVLVAKVLDGRERGYRWVVPSILEELGWIDQEHLARWRQEHPLEVENVAGRVVGEVTVLLPSPEALEPPGSSG